MASEKCIVSEHRDQGRVSNVWSPRTFEDQLLARLHQNTPGALYLEVVVGLSDGPSSARRIDGVLIPGPVSTVHPSGSYSREQLAQAVDNQPVHVLEAKRALNRDVIGQALSAAHLMGQDYHPADIHPGVVVSRTHTDLEGVCQTAGIAVYLFSELAPHDPSNTVGTRTGHSNTYEESGRIDARKPGDLARRRAFLSGWAAAANGKLFDTVTAKKTHANMGNLFGWIYGHQSREFQLATWERYLNATQNESDDTEKGDTV